MSKTSVSISFGLAFFCFLYGPPSVFAAPSIFWQDTFNSGNLSQWQTARNRQWINAAQPCEWYAQAASWVNDGQRAGIQLFSNPCITELVATNLDLRNIPHYRVGAEISLTESLEMDRGFIFAWVNPENYYALKFYGDTVRIFKYVQGREIALTNSVKTFPFLPNQNYHLAVDVQLGNRIQLKINTQPVLDIQDSGEQLPTDSPISIALQAATGEVPKNVVWFDNVAVESVSDTYTQLAVQPWKQTDPLWANKEYDRATKWSDQPSIQRWGCALTSAASVLHYHGIRKLPNNAELSPASLNDWLNAQPDGYLGEGAINWLAVSRLTQQMAKTLRTPKLEYRKLAGDEIIARQLIQDSQPPILEIPGHFMVGKGIDQNQKILIQDPAYSFDRFEQHQQALLSVRQFKPSQTDLSYLLFTSPIGTQIEVRDSQNNLVSTTSTEFLKDPITGKTSPKLQVTEVRQPQIGEYRISIIPVTSSYQVKMLSYDQEANLTQHTLGGQTGNVGDTYSLQFQKKGPSKVVEQTSWQTLEKKIQLFIKQKAFKHPIIAVELLHAVKMGPKLPYKSQRHFIQTLQVCLRLGKHWVTPVAYAYLQNHMQMLAEQIKK